MAKNGNRIWDIVPQSISTPLFQTSGFAFSNPSDMENGSTMIGYPGFYRRHGNPTTNAAAEALQKMEGAEASLITSSGMSAIFLVLFGLLNEGDHVITQKHLYGTTKTLFSYLVNSLGISVSYVDQCDLVQFEDAIRKETKLIYCESPSNPLLALTDLKGVVRLARKKKILTAVDSTIASSFNQRPLTVGFDLVIHSATKYHGGHSDLMLGAICGNKRILENLWSKSLLVGAVASPFESWLLLRGLKTYEIRVTRQNESALAIANFLQEHSKVKKVYYPGLPSHPQHELACKQMKGFGGLLSFELKDAKISKRFISGLRKIHYAPSFGGTESVLIHPASMLRKTVNQSYFDKMGISAELLRLSVGLEPVEELLEELQTAL